MPIVTPLALVLSVAIQQADQPLVIKGPPPATPQGWHAFATPDGQATAAFPADPKQQERTAPGAGGRRIPVVSFEHNAGPRGAFLLTYTDYPQGTIKPDKIQGFYDQQIERIAARGGRVVRQRAIDLEGHSGRDFDVANDQTPLASRFRVRAVIVGDRAYQLMWVGSDKADTADAQAFLDSFRPKAP